MLHEASIDAFLWLTIAIKAVLIHARLGTCSEMTR